ncbi:MAG: CopD family protein [Comamonadaceae bacterium]|nr:CopD family protein [Comamonadaceae bacterium]
MSYALLKTLHLLAIIVWVGGMVFAHFFLRPAVAALEPPARLRLMHDVLGRFFAAVLVASLLTLLSGLGMIGHAATRAEATHFGLPLDWSLMAALGLVMIAIFGHIRFVLYARLGRAVGTGRWPDAAAALMAIRRWVGVNLALGVAVVVFTLAL